MMKNSEWGAVAYLTQSSFGRNGTEITINNKNLNNLNSKNIHSITGYGNGAPNNIAASSTGNRTGVFDLSGGTTERTAGYMQTTSANGSSFATGTSNKYATVYPYDVDNSGNTTANYTAYKNAGYGFGDAILETSSSGSGSTSWHGDYSNFVSSGYPFFGRGGHCNNGGGAGAFVFSNNGGSAGCSDGFRACLVGSGS